ncbi:MAG TPA: PBP1A family penicillin-binding protein [Longimicrobiaceae bacterium]|nr:PBP1A family penicillin-binding protein [Longimicrobiaceae bacterium]
MEGSRASRTRRTLKIALLALLALAVIGFSWLWFAPCGLGGCAPVSELERFQAEGSQLLDRNGRPWGTLATVNRRVVPLDSLPPYLPQAFLAVEDRRFYRHQGVDWQRVAGALVSNVERGGVAEGGSTLTMQLARNLFPEHLPYRERSLRRKLMEIRIARQIERAFDKPKILELYLNHIYLGQGAYGVEAAAQEYFGKPAARLTLAEAATLGGLPVAPARINPREDRRAARARRDLVLREMAGAGFVSEAQAAAAAAEPLRLRRRVATGVRAGYFMERVRRELEAQLGDRFYTEGMRVYTTFDPAAQRVAEEELSRQLRAVEAGGFGRYLHPTYASTRGETEDGVTPYLQGMVLVMEAATGEVRALVGGRDYEDSKFDRAFQALRQPGSAFKPFVYLAALQRGIPPTEIYQDAPVRLLLAGGRVWEPRNYNGSYGGNLTVREALTRSANAVTVRLAQEVGVDAVIRAARDLGISSDIPAVPATALGAAEVRPAELAAAYAAFGNGGEVVTPHVVRRVETRDGELVWEAAPERRRALEPEEAFVLTTLLRDVVDRGSGSPVRAAGFRGPAAGKTGTTNAATDIWFAGYTPDLVGVVWMGLDRPAPIVRGASGGTIAAPVWGRMMSRIYAAGRRMPMAWVQPRGVVSETVERRTGLAVDPSCPPTGETYTEYFVHVRPPRPICYPSVPYPMMTLDTAWRDQEWGGDEDDGAGSGDLESRGVYWPELEEKRRREAAGAPPPPPLPGSVETPAPPPAPPATPYPPEPRRASPTPAPPPAPEPRRPPRVLGQPVGEPPAPPDSAGARR